ncbi:MAG: PD-(D/E)XK nuclease family protein [Pirellulales bacterium]
MNALVTNLADIFIAQRLREKWLIAPSRRIGHQWLDGLALAGHSAINVHIKTPRSMAIDLASPAMTAQQVTLVTPEAALFLMDRVLRRMPKGSLKYLPEAAGGRRLAQTVLFSLEFVRLTGLDVDQLDHAGLEVSVKGDDLALIAKHYAKELEQANLADYATILHLAIGSVVSHPENIGADVSVLFPDDLRLCVLEHKLFEAIPVEQRHVLRTDQPAESAMAKVVTSDLDRLRWLPIPAEAPAPVGDQTVGISCAVGEVNEVRAALRHCLAAGWSFDQVELLHTDADTYVPLIYEALSAVDRPDGESAEELPVTFSEGIPVRYSRPGRCLAMWLTWMREGFPQASLVRAIREGLLEMPGEEQEHSGMSRLAAQFRGIGIGLGRDRYLTKVDEQLSSLQSQLDEAQEAVEEDDEEASRRVLRLQTELRDAKVLRTLIERLLAVTPEVGARVQDVIAGAKQFVEMLARRANKLDQFAASKLLEEINSLGMWLSGADHDTGLDVWQWLADLPAQTRVLGSGPRPGMLHVDNVRSGGHSGRLYTFIVGLDDSRFPGAGLQDPLLLDSERHNLSPTLPTTATRLGEAIEDFARLLARLRGQLSLSFCCHNVVDDRQMFPSPVLLAAYRVLAGKPDADQSDLLTALNAPASFAPASVGDCLSANEWWLWRFCGPESVDGADELMQRQFPHLAQGQFARERRQSDDFTAYDGCVPAAGKRFDPTTEEGRVVSASALQTLGSCPLRFFYKYGLGIEPPDEVVVDTSRWLDPLAFGSMLHELFEQFMRELLSKNLLPKFARDKALLETMLVDKVAQYRDLYPPPTPSAFESQSRELRIAAATFLREEEQFCEKTGSQPVYLEASLGLPADGHGTPLDTADPVPVELPNGKLIRTRGRIDRIDRVGAGAIETYAVWDYKSGSTYGYERANPFRQGRLIQHVLYVSIVTHRLREVVSHQAQVTNFGFFFPGSRAAGQRVEWSSSELAAGLNVLELMCNVLHEGAFLPTNDHETDCNYCDYQAVCGDVVALAEASQRKLDNTKNRRLKPFKELRPHG